MLSRHNALCLCNIFVFILGALLVAAGLLLQLHFMEKIVHSIAKKVSETFNSLMIFFRKLLLEQKMEQMGRN